MQWRSNLPGTHSKSEVETRVELKALDFHIPVPHPFRGWMRPWGKVAESSAGEHKGLRLSPPPGVKAGALMLIKMALHWAITGHSPHWAQSQRGD